MPLYEYRCRECGKTFEELVTVAEQPVTCPACGSSDVERLLSMFAACGGSSHGDSGAACGSGFS